MNEPPLSRRERLRRTALLCAHCIRNLAYYRAARTDGALTFSARNRLHVTINGNFLDVMVLEWCKLFVPREEHAWRNVVTDTVPARPACGRRLHPGAMGRVP